MSRGFLVLIMSALPLAARAHNADGGGFAAGMMHPLAGADHLLIMLAAGLLAARLARSNMVLGVWLSAALLGFISGALWPQLAHEGWMIGGLAAIVMAAFATPRLRLRLTPILLGAAWYAQGLLHGAEAPAATPAAFAAGFLVLSGVFVMGLMLIARRASAMLPLMQQMVGWLALLLGFTKMFS